MSNTAAKFADFLRKPVTISDLGRVYCDGMLQFNFSLSASIDPFHPFSLRDSDYERNLIKFFSGDPTDLADEARGPGNSGLQSAGVCVLRGATGSGKTTTLRYTAWRAAKNLLQRKSQKTLSLIWLELNSVDKAFITDAQEDVWSYLSGEVSISNAKDVNGKKVWVEDERSISDLLKGFYSWLGDQTEFLVYLESISKFYRTNAPKLYAFSRGDEFPGIETTTDLVAMIDKERSEAIKAMTPREAFFYEIAKMKYFSQKNSGGAHQVVVVVDNVDQLPPEFQVALVGSAEKIAHLLGCRIVIAVRPLTWKDLHGVMTVEATDHLAPEFKCVLDKRIEKFCSETHVPFSDKAELQQLSRLVFERSSLIGKIVRGSNGLSVRSFLNNFANFLESQLFDQVSVQQMLHKDIHQSDICRAYLFGKLSYIDLERFENLSTIRQAVRVDGGILKLRILDFVARIRPGETRVREVLSFCEKFGSTRDDFFAALNELMRRRRALIWCEKSFQLDDGPEEEAARLSIAPMGATYYRDLLGEYSYIEACLSRRWDEDVYPTRIVEYAENLIVADKAQVEFFLRNSSAEEYLSFYDYDYISIGAIMWRTFQKGLSKRMPERFDGKWENKIRSDFSNLTGLEYLSTG